MDVIDYWIEAVYAAQWTSSEIYISTNLLIYSDFFTGDLAGNSHIHLEEKMHKRRQDLKNIGGNRRLALLDIRTSDVKTIVPKIIDYWLEIEK